MLNRVNMGAAFALATLAAPLLVGYRRAWARAGAFLALAGFLSMCLIAHWSVGSDWGKAWAIQRHILARIIPALPPGPARVVLVNQPPTLKGAPVFWTHYDITGALSAVAERSDIAADWAGPWSKWEEDSVLVEDGDHVQTRYSYDGLLVYDGMTDRVITPLRRRS